MATIEIRMLGDFEIRVNGKPVLAVLGQSRKTTALVQYLVLQRGERVTHKVLTDTLWAGERSSNPDMALRAILHRFRNMIEAEGLDELRNCILTSRGCYQWNPHLDCTVDVFRVGDLSEQARREEDPEKRAKLYEQIVDLYRGRLLPQSASEQWVEGVSVRLHGQYRTAMLSLLELCKKWGESTRIISLCNHALELDPYEERLYLEEIVALEALGRHNEAQKLARRGTAMGCLHHAIEPAAPVRLTARCARLTAIWKARSPSWWLLCPTPRMPGPASAISRRSKSLPRAARACRPATACRCSWQS